jgi:CheY-like chemotaxis protein
VDEGTPLDVYGDELRIKQILNNLLSNAFKYTEFGEVGLSVAAELADKDTDIFTLLFKVSDTGQGMSEEQIDKLFDVYTRFNMQTNRTTMGTGLGMNITKHLVDMMNGEISVESAPGKGTVFTVRLPQKRIGAAVCGAEISNQLQRLRLQRTSKIQKWQIYREYMPYGSVLIVDDVASNLHVAKGLLLPYGLSIEIAGSGFEAIDKIKSGKVYDIVFMDHMMPKMDGMEATKIIRDMGYVHPIVALTANAVSGQAEIFMANGFDRFISKPIDTRELNAILNDLIRDRQPPEVIEAARRKSEGSAAVPISNVSISPEIMEAFLEDAENAISVIEKICQNSDSITDIQLYTITVHGMKSALSNMGEAELSHFAARLEAAGQEQAEGTILSETPNFLSGLKMVIEKLKPKNES